MSNVLKNFFFGTVLTAMAAPLAITIGVSVNEKKALFFPPRGFSFRWYEELFFKSAWLDALLTSLSIAAITGILTLFLALPISYFLWRYEIRYAKVLFGIGLMPFAIPPVISAMGFLAFWSEIGMAGNMINIVLAHAIFLVTLPLVILSLGLESVDKEILEEAETLGADQKTVFRTIVLPSVTPFLFAGFSFVFVLSMNEFVISFFVGQFTTVPLPVKIFSQLRSGYSPVIATASVFFIALSLLVFSLVAYFGDLPKLLGASNESE